MRVSTFFIHSSLPSGVLAWCRLLTFVLRQSCVPPFVDTARPLFAASGDNMSSGVFPHPLGCLPSIVNGGGLRSRAWVDQIFLSLTITRARSRTHASNIALSSACQTRSTTALVMLICHFNNTSIVGRVIQCTQPSFAVDAIPVASAQHVHAAFRHRGGFLLSFGNVAVRISGKKSQTLCDLGLTQ